MSIAPHTGIVDFGTFTAPTALTDGIQGEVPQPLAGQENYVLTATGWAPGGGGGGGSGTVTQINTGTGLTGGPITTSGTVALANTAVSPGSYTNANITVDQQGRITLASNGSAGGVTSFSGGSTGLTPNTATTGAISLAGTLAVGYGGTGQTTQQTALNALSGSVTAGSYLRGNGTNVVMSTIQAADVPTLNQNTTGTASNVTETVAVVNGGTGSTSAAGARSNLSAAQSGANTDITSIALTTGTISTAPSSSTDIVNKSYADSIASGVNFHAACSYATTAALAANTYNNGASGVGATLTAVAVGTLTIDSYTLVVGDVGKRLLIKNEATQANNGVYTLTQAGTALLPYILTRATDYDSSGSGTNEVDQGDYILVISGTVNANTSWVQQTPLPITIGSTSIVFIEFAASQTYTAGTGLTLTTNQFSITNTGTAGTYGSASQVPVFVTNAQGQVTSVTNTNIAISGSAVSGNISGNAANVTDTVAIGNGGTGQTTQQSALNALAGTTTSGSYLRGNGTNVVMSAIQASDVPTLNQNTTGTASNITASSNSTLTTLSSLNLSGSQISGNISGNAANVTGTVAIANGGTGQTTASAAFNALSPITSTGDLILGNGTNSATRLAIGASTYVLTSDGTTASWAAPSSGGSPGGSNTQVQFNNSGAFAGSSAITLTTTTATASALRVNPRVSSAASPTSPLTPDFSSYDIYAITGLTTPLTINAPTGTPVDGNKLIFRILDNGTARALTWDATYTVIGVTLPTTTTASKTTYVGCIYNANNTRWDVIAVTTQA